MDKIVISLLNSLGLGKYGLFPMSVEAYVEQLCKVIHGFSIIPLHDIKDGSVEIALTDDDEAYVLTVYTTGNDSRKIDRLAIRQAK